MNRAHSTTFAGVCNSTNHRAEPGRVSPFGPQALPTLTVEIDGEQITLDHILFADLPTVGELRRRCEAASAPPLFRLAGLLDVDDETRWSVLSLVNVLGSYCRLRCGEDGPQAKELLEAALRLMVGTEDVVHCERGRRAALEAAALVYPDALEVACSKVANQLRNLGVRGIGLAKLVKEARAIAGRAIAAPEFGPGAAAEAFVSHLRHLHDLHALNPVLRYYRHDYYLWSGNCWRRLDDEELKSKLICFLQDDPRMAELTEPFVRDVLVNLKGLILLDCWQEEMPFWVDSENPLRICRPKLVTLKNAMLDLEPVIESKPTQQYHVSPKYFSLAALPYAYDPAASCPLWQQTLADLFPNPRSGDRRVDVLQEFMGLTLIPTELAFQKFLILCGKGNNGKSTILDVWAHVLGKDNVSHVPLDHFGSEFRLHEMMGKLANIAGDMNHINKVAEGILKQLTTGDRVQVNRKYKPPLTICPTARLIFSTNALPPIYDRSEGTWRRMIVMPLQVQFTAGTVDRWRVSRLLPELPGILNWALLGARRLYQQRGFSRCEVCEACLAEHRLDCDAFRQFIDARVDFGHGLHVYSGDLYAEYTKFCDTNGRKARNSSEFGKQVLELTGVSKSREGTGDRKWLYAGIGLRGRPVPPSVYQRLGVDAAS